jgi:cysteinyl-tRNA synthetase
MQNLKIYNSLTKAKEPFVPVTPKKIGIYVCGMTVYDYCHLGNARVFIFFDLLVKYLRSLGYEVLYVRNITDIDDKIIKRAEKLNESAISLAERMINEQHQDEKALLISPPDIEPRVTKHLPEIIQIITSLIEKKYAYEVNGDVYYDIAKFSDYGKLAHKDLDTLKAGARVEINEQKKDPLDFVLWKKAKPGEPSWDSPWGKGRPGWHIECSAMASRYLGNHFDIHGGGSDLKFPHHQNELAQSEGAFGEKFVNFWIHVGFLEVDQKKMSKSLGNFFTVREVLKKYSAETIRYFMAASHYRSPLNYSEENLKNAENALKTLYLALRGLDLKNATNSTDPEITNFTNNFTDAMNDDFNTPLAIKYCFDLVHHINNLKAQGKTEAAISCAKTLKEKALIFGFLQKNPEEFLQEGIDVKKIEDLIQKRNQARQEKNWSEADRVRKELETMGVILEDTASGTVWRKS